MKKALTLLLSLILSAMTVGCFDSGTPEIDASNADSDVNNNMGDDTAFNVTSVLIGKLDALPSDFESALLWGAPVGGLPAYYVFDEGLTYYRYSFEKEFHQFELSLPESYRDGKIIFIGSGAGSGEILMVIEAKNENETVYFECVFYPDYHIDSPGNLIFMGGGKISAEDAEMYRGFAEEKRNTVQSEADGTSAIEDSLYEEVADYLDQEFHRVYDPYYDILSLTISKWDENGNEATFNYNMTFRYYNRDPDTVEYIMKAKLEDPERYEMMYNDYLASKQVNYQFKIISAEDGFELYFNVSPTGTEWVKTTIDDFIPGNARAKLKNIELTESYPCSSEDIQTKTENLILNFTDTSTVLHSEDYSYDDGNMLTAYTAQSNETSTYFLVCYLYDAKKSLLYEYVSEIGDLEALRKINSTNAVRDFFNNFVFKETNLSHE